MTFIVENPERADVFLSARLNCSRSSAQKLLAAGLALLGGQALRASSRLKPGDEISLQEPAAAAENNAQNASYQADFAVQVLYEDEDILLLNKPAGVATHGCASLREASLVDWLLARGGVLSDLAGNQRAGIVHRLDKPTSGALVIAKSNAAHAALGAQLAARKIERIYLALCDFSYSGCCESFIARNPKNRLKMLSTPLEKGLCLGAGICEKSGFSLGAGNCEKSGFSLGAGRKCEKSGFSLGAGNCEKSGFSLGAGSSAAHDARAATAHDARAAAAHDAAATAHDAGALAEPRSRAGRYARSFFADLSDLAAPSRGALLAVRLYTGRTHQIRAQLAAANRFIYGDELYAPRAVANACERMLLHSFLMKFAHPLSGQMLQICAPLDKTFKNYLPKDFHENTFTNLLTKRLGI